MKEIKIEWKGIEESFSPIIINKERTLMGYNKPIKPSSGFGKKFWQAPKKIPPVFDGSQLVVFGVFPKNKPKPTGATIKAESSEGPLILDLEVCGNQFFVFWYKLLLTSVDIFFR